MCAEKHVIIFGSFIDIGEMQSGPSFFGPPRTIIFDIGFYFGDFRKVITRFMC